MAFCLFHSFYKFFLKFVSVFGVWNCGDFTFLAGCLVHGSIASGTIVFYLGWFFTLRATRTGTVLVTRDTE